MPIGIIANVSAVFLGGLIGGAIRKKLPETLRENLPTVFAFCAMAIGFPLVGKADALVVVVTSLILGYIVGEALRLETGIHRCVERSYRKVFKSKSIDDQYIKNFLPVIVMFCASGTGLFGAMQEGFTGDASILLAKSILDFFTAIIFGASLDYFVAFVCIPQAALLFLLFFSAKAIMPAVSAATINNFSAVGGIISVMAGFRLAKLKEVQIINILPALLLVFPLSFLWSRIMG